MSTNEQSGLLFSQLTDEIRNLNRLLLSVDWKEAKLDDCTLGDSDELICTKLSEPQNELISCIIKYIPEWKRLIGCRQHKIHDFCLDIHTLTVIKNIQKSQAYEKLSDYEKLIVLYSALLHDIEKNENEVDPEHPAKGAKLSSSILYRLGFGEDFINSVYLLIKYHQILGLLASGRLNLPDEEIVDMFKTPELVDLQLVLSIADIKSVKKDGTFYAEGLDEKFEQLKSRIKNLICNS